ncbi:transposase [Paenibacillus sp. S150]|nr:transposase [Paenibacillus sp. S150]
MHQQKGKILPRSKLGEAIGYCLNPWHKLTLFLEDGRMELENTGRNAP